MCKDYKRGHTEIHVNLFEELFRLPRKPNCRETCGPDTRIRKWHFSEWRRSTFSCLSLRTLFWLCWLRGSLMLFVSPSDLHRKDRKDRRTLRGQVEHCFAPAYWIPIGPIEYLARATVDSDILAILAFLSTTLSIDDQSLQSDNFAQQTDSPSSMSCCVLPHRFGSYAATQTPNVFTGLLRQLSCKHWKQRPAWWLTPTQVPWNIHCSSAITLFAMCKDRKTAEQSYSKIIKSSQAT